MYQSLFGPAVYIQAYCILFYEWMIIDFQLLFKLWNWLSLLFRGTAITVYRRQRSLPVKNCFSRALSGPEKEPIRQKQP